MQKNNLEDKKDVKLIAEKFYKFFRFHSSQRNFKL